MGKIDVITEINEVGENTVLVVRLPKKMKVLSTTVLNGGFSLSDTILSVQVPIHYNGTTRNRRSSTSAGRWVFVPDRSGS